MMDLFSTVCFLITLAMVTPFYVITWKARPWWGRLGYICYVPFGVLAVTSSPATPIWLGIFIALGFIASLVAMMMGIGDGPRPPRRKKWAVVKRKAPRWRAHGVPARRPSFG